MTNKDRLKWDARHRRRPGDPQPSPIVRAYWDLATRGQALDIACGNGRNSIFLADKGFVVDAVDISTVATNALAGSHPHVHVLCRDLDTWTIPPCRYALVVMIRFLDRRLFPMIEAGLRPGGVVIIESFMEGKRKAYCLQPNELLHAFRAFTVVHYEENQSRDEDGTPRTACYVGRKIG